MNQYDDMLIWVGNSWMIQNVYCLIQQVAKTPTNVLILGESGTGKELVAKILHAHSDRCDHPFVPVNCAAIPSELLESELFGHEKGAFTGAYIARQGKFEMANGGTLFLDEIGDMPLAMQAKLLRVLQEKIFERVGGNKPIKADVRILSATHKNLEAGLKEGNFREDLYYRLNVFPIEIPALRERKEDILPLLNYFLNKLKEERGIIFELSSEAIQSLEHYDWPGNIRELSNLIERLSVLYPNQTIKVEDLPVKYQLSNKLTDKKLMVMGRHGDLGRHGDRPLQSDSVDLKEHLAQLEVNIITEALELNQGIIAKAAEYLGLRRTTLTEKMKKYGIERN